MMSLLRHPRESGDPVPFSTGGTREGWPPAFAGVTLGAWEGS